MPVKRLLKINYYLGLGEKVAIMPDARMQAEVVCLYVEVKQTTQMA